MNQDLSSKKIQKLNLMNFQSYIMNLDISRPVSLGYTSIMNRFNMIIYLKIFYINIYRQMEVIANSNSLWFDNFYISKEGLSKTLEKSKQAKYPGQHVIWTDDFRVELPIRLGKDDIQSLQPTTIIDQWKITLKKFGKLPAVSTKKSGKWVTMNYEEYFQECLKFAKALLFHGYSNFAGVNIIGFNAPEWCIAYFGSIFVQCMPVGIYTTNIVAACQYIAQHSQARLVVAQNQQCASKYYDLLAKGKIDRIIIYGQQVKNKSFGDKIIGWNAFINSGSSISTKQVDQIGQRIRPGHCATLIYTSGTTGMPKGVMLSHDNYIWTNKSSMMRLPEDMKMPGRMVSYLPLSHAAGQFIDIVRPLIVGTHMFFADATALQGSLIQTLQEVKPEAFFSVPRVWQKIYDKMMEIAKSNGAILSKIGTWAKSIGEQGTLQQARGQETSLQFKLAKKLVYNKVKTALGLQQCKLFIFGSAPLDPVIRKYFFSLNMFLRNGYGMTESTAPQSSTDPHRFNRQKPEGYLQVGSQIPGSNVMIYKLNPTDEQGQICMRGRNTFMGYFKNAEDTSKTIDSEGYLHSGDVGKLTKDNILFITGRVKELIITAGGQNIPPVLIQNEIKNALPCLSNVMAIGDHKKYLTCLISLKEDPPLSGNLQKVAITYLASKGLNIKTVKQAVNNQQFKKIIKQGLALANTKAISRAQHVQQFFLMTEDFSIDNGLLTPIIKIKRKEALKRYASQIQTMYTTAKL